MSATKLSSARSAASSSDVGLALAMAASAGSSAFNSQRTQRERPCFTALSAQTRATCGACAALADLFQNNQRPDMPGSGMRASLSKVIAALRSRR